MTGRAWLFLAATALAGAPAHAAGEVDAFLATPLVVPDSAGEVTARCDSALAIAAKLKAGLEARGAAADARVFLAKLDDLSSILTDVGSEAYLVSETNPDAAKRQAGEKCYVRIGDAQTLQMASPAIQAALHAIRAKPLDAASTQMVDRQSIERRFAGADLDAATRAKAVALQRQITETGLKFDGNIRDGEGVTLLDPAALAGLPADYVAAHPPGKDGKIRITTAYPDTIPIFKFATDRDARRAVLTTFYNRAWPQNGPVLKTLIAERDDYAKLLGYANYAGLALADRMAGTPRRAFAFLDEVNAAADPGAKRDFAEMLARWRKIDPQATGILRSDAAFVRELVRKEKYDAGSAETRRYFTYLKVRDGIFRLVHDLFGADIRPWRTLVWAEGVTAWELYDKGRLIGRFYLDPSPRADKYTHAAEFPIRSGVAGRLVPVASLITNFPASGPMEHGDVVTFLHEFGHLIHHIYSGQQRYGLLDMNMIESDFGEAPSQFLEEWAWNYDTLATFATDDDGRVIPRTLVDNMNRARKFALGISAKDEIGYADASLLFYTTPPAAIDPDRIMREADARFALYEQVPGAHDWASFTHLNGYSAAYYTYAWSKVIALDLFTRFQAAGMYDPATAMAYRHDILEAGSSAPADTLVTRFLGRPTNVEAYKRRLEGR